MNEYQSPEWGAVSWHRQDGNYLIIHALCIKPASQHRGYGQKIMEFCEAYATKHGYDGIRLDAFSENPAALKFYEKRGFKKMGEVEFDSKPVNHQTYCCFEKMRG